MILDIYFRRPVFWDYLFSIVVISVLMICFIANKISLPTAEDTYALSGDLTNVALTMVGFILTILTVLITFKDNSNTKSIAEDESAFNRFFATNYYYETVRHLKNCIKSITVIAALGFLFKLFVSKELRQYLFFFNILGLIITILTVYRCLLILTKVIELQKVR